MSKTLAMKFGTASGDTRIITVSDLRNDLDAGIVSTSMNAIVNAGAAFEDPLVTVLKAEVTERLVTVLLDNE